MQPATTYATPSPGPPAEPLWQRRGVQIALRVAAVVAGLAGALAGLFFAGLFAVFAQCSGDATGLCTNYAGLVPFIEWAIVIVAFGAPLAGGIASCRRKEWQWLPLGLVTAAAMVGLSMIVSSGQTGILS